MTVKQSSVLFDPSTGKARRLEKQLILQKESDLSTMIESNVIGIYPDYTFQTMEGWGCAMTESACFLLSKLSVEERNKALTRWFGPEGMDARFIRIHIDSCDYSLSEYQAVEDPISDPELATFTIDRDRKWILPIVKEALALAGHPIQVLLSPWSPPWQWKTPPEISHNDAAVYGGQYAEVDLNKPGRCFGGRLKKEYYGSWAKYLVKYLQAYLAEGIPVTMLSIQNEASAATSWDSCLWSGEDERLFLKEYLYPEMEKAGLAGKIELFIWDHNKERAIEHIDEFMGDPDAAGKISGFAYHWYSGDHFEALDLLHRQYPDQILMHSESCALHIPGKVSSLPDKNETEQSEKTPNECDYDDAIAYAHDIIGDLNNGMHRWIDWNMIVDRTGGPRHVYGGFSAPLIFEENGSFSETVSYLYLNEIAKAVYAGAVRLGKSVWNRDVEVTACRNPDQSVSVLILNQAQKDLAVNLRISGFILQNVLLPARALSVIRLE